jgi:phage FluMu protein Com
MEHFRVVFEFHCPRCGHVNKRDVLTSAVDEDDVMRKFSGIVAAHERR